MSLNIFFWTHTAAGLTPLLEQVLSAADIVVLEEAASTPFLSRLESVFNDVSHGRRKPELAMSVIPDWREVYSSLLRKIYGTRKKIVLERASLTPNDINTMYKLELSRCPNLDEALKEYGNSLRRRGEYQRKRDRGFAQQLADLAQSNPSANIPVIRGSAHKRGLESFLESKGIVPMCHVSHTRMLGLESEIVSKLEVGEEPSETELLMSMYERLLIGRCGLDPQNPDLEKLARIEDLVLGMSNEDLRKALAEPKKS